MHWATGLLASLGRVTAPRTGLPSNRFITSPVNPLGKSSCWDNVRIPTGCWPSGVEGTCFETGNIDQREPARDPRGHPRSEEHTSELQSLAYLVCRLLLEKKKKIS